MARYTVDFDKVGVKATTTVIVDGKKRKRTRTFYQYQNPFNENKDGFMKSTHDIMRETSAERDAWLAECAAGVKAFDEARKKK